MKRYSRSLFSRSWVRQFLSREVRCAFVALAAFGVAALSPPDFSSPDIISGKPLILDGDTLELKGQRVLLFGIDAPETHQSCRIFGLDWPCGERARIWLERFVDDALIRCFPRTEALVDDRGNYLKAMCYNAENLNLNAAMMGEGLAVHNGIDGDRFEPAEFAARINRRGIWAGQFVSPQDWRDGQRMPVAPGERGRALKR